MAFRTIQKSIGTPSVKRSAIRSAVRSVTRDKERLIARHVKRHISSAKAAPRRSAKITRGKRRVG